MLKNQYKKVKKIIFIFNKEMFQFFVKTLKSSYLGYLEQLSKIELLSHFINFYVHAKNQQNLMRYLRNFCEWMFENQQPKRAQQVPITILKNHTKINSDDLAILQILNNEESSNLIGQEKFRVKTKESYFHQTWRLQRK